MGEFGAVLSISSNDARPFSCSTLDLGDEIAAGFGLFSEDELRFPSLKRSDLNTMPSPLVSFDEG